MSSIHEAVDGVVPGAAHGRSSAGAALPDAQLIQQLHDGPSQWMALALLQLDRALSTGRQVDARLLDGVRTLLSEATRSIRGVLEDWCDTELPPAMSMVDALSDLGLRVAALTGLSLRVQCDNPATDPPATVSFTVLNVAQEVLLNTCKHAPGAHAAMRLRAIGSGFELSICDDGPGFDPVAMYRRHDIVGGLGLGALPRRMTSVGGSFSILSRPGHGTQVLIRWPAIAGCRDSHGHGGCRPDVSAR
ncbi:MULTISPECIES: sensor histidine kinase [Rhodanobacter]|uniref:histidine kinase n=1 Tax=Rhodanobacter glycinis TaxID=582702 RepID=A0A1I3ZW39_9GAMM|nr:ATP-binding protein [Rhodanobacter glycinis]TAM08236.1 MAG: hypothetical protein EPN67_02800 [Pusillimonas sp.]SFK48117.1 hypothetical protein SAMN05192579_103138 [Rhodanobacter glycinis]